MRRRRKIIHSHSSSDDEDYEENEPQQKHYSESSSASEYSSSDDDEANNSKNKRKSRVSSSRSKPSLSLTTSASSSSTRKQQQQTKQSNSSSSTSSSSSRIIRRVSNHHVKKHQVIDWEVLKQILVKRRQIYDLELKKAQLEREASRKAMSLEGSVNNQDEVSPYLKYPSSVLLMLLQHQESEEQHCAEEEEKKKKEKRKKSSSKSSNSVDKRSAEFSSSSTLNDGDSELDSTALPSEPIMLTESTIPKHCVPIRTDVRNMNWKALARVAQFDVILMDPPWQLATSNPLRGVAISYKPLSDKHIQSMDISSLQEKNGGFLFVWVINAKYVKTLEMIEKWGYKFVDEITWVKQTKHRRLAKGHGYYLQHAKENCIIAIKNTTPEREKEMMEAARQKVTSLCDVILSDRRGQSQKPEDLYHFIEQMVPDGKYLEIFGRRNNLRDYWVTIGNEL